MIFPVARYRPRGSPPVIFGFYKGTPDYCDQWNAFVIDGHNAAFQPCVARE